jgi:hypothetical protein
VVAAGVPERWFASAIERPGRVIDRHTPSPYNPPWFERGKRFGGRRRIRDAGRVAMDEDRTLSRVELESDSEPIAGRIPEPGGRAQEFAGYMSLIEALERLRRPPGSRPSTSPPLEGLSHMP